MWVLLLLLAVLACVGLDAELRPETYTRYSLAEYAIGPLQRLPLWCVRVFGPVLLVGAIGFLYGSATRLLK